MSSSRYRSNRLDPDNISLVSAAPSLAPSYHTIFNDTQLIPPTYRSYISTEPRSGRGGRRSLSASSANQPSLSVYHIPGFQNFGQPRNEEALHKIAARRHSQAMENTLKQFSINYERQEFGRGSASSHPMLVAKAKKSTTLSENALIIEEDEEDDDRCPLERDNEVWDYGFMCQGSYPSLQYYQRRAREITRYEEKEAAIKLAHRRLCVQRSDSDASTDSTASSVSTFRD